jgi:Tol biopolymer transport system component
VRGVTGLVEGHPDALTPFVFVMDLDDGQPREFARATRATWSPDGSRVLIEEDNGARLIMADADGSNRRDFVLGGAPVWSPDGSRIAYTTPGHDDSGQPFLAVVDVDGREIWSGVVGQAPSWSPDGSRLAIEIRHPEMMVEVLDAASGESLWQTPGTGPAWRPLRSAD